MNFRQEVKYVVYLFSVLVKMLESLKVVTR